MAQMNRIGDLRQGADEIDLLVVRVRYSSRSGFGFHEVRFLVGGVDA